LGRASSERPNIVYFTHPKRHWKDALGTADYCVFENQRYFDETVRDRKFLIPPGVDLNIFTPNIKIGMVAWKQPRKGADLLHDFIRSANLKYFTFYLYGPGWEDDIREFQKYVNVVYTPKASYDYMPTFYRAIDYLLVVSEREGGPMPIIEAMACGKPVISTDVGFVGEVDVIKYSGIDELIEIFHQIVKKYRKPIRGYTWGNFRTKHIEMFRGLNGRICD
jgi:glycosyltransferase involved in cell wall biosynthesis